ncbi:MAG: HEAT repeat domain-containing protein, partial [Planctomycetaceae bacterium]|nr:HEAT repeat domain-containing protein [Planctomycetaceae bacterium]
ERGEIIGSREKGTLVKFVDEDGDGIPEKVTEFCDKVKNCQGLLPLNGDIYAVGEGPDGTAFYRISDADKDGVGETLKTLIKFKGKIQEHGPHAALLGPDGLIYLMIGNHSSVDGDVAATSPHRRYYEGDLVQPRYEDAGGHAVGIKAPGGTVIRTDIDGSFVETFCGGFRNAYDMAFNRQGDLFAYDADMEWDENLPWYRPTRVNHAIPGAEFGWRSGWAKWPEYFLDSLPATINTGRGSPTGVECYNHYQFPKRYHNALFLADWSLGRILAVRIEPSGGSYQARSEVFVQGKPLNVTDLAVGPDGALYFTTGGRNTEGGIYRIVYTGKVPPQPRRTGIMQAITQPQLQSSWGRNRAANLRREMGDRWDREIAAVADNPQFPGEDRARALDLMQLIGPLPSTDLLANLSHDNDATLRAKTAELMGIHHDDATNTRLVAMLSDRDPTVRRKACEALVRSGQLAPVGPLLAMLADSDRFVAWAAKRALEERPRDDWQSLVLTDRNPRVFLLGSIALLSLDPDPAVSEAVLNRAREWMQSFLNDDDFLGLLRVVEVALHRGSIPPDRVAGLRQQLSDEYPALEPRMNRELIRLLVYLQEPTLAPRLIAALNDAQIPTEEKVHAAMYGRFLQAGWSGDQKLSLLAFYDQSRLLPGGHSFKGYLDNASRDFVGTFTPEELVSVLRRGREFPNAALSALTKISEKPGPDMINLLVGLDRSLLGMSGDAAARLGTGLVAVLGRSRDPAAMAYLREVFELQPERRQEAAMGLAQDPTGENWPVLVRALPVVDGPAAHEVITHLKAVDQAPDKPEPVRQVILAGLKLKQNGGKDAVQLLEKWTGQKLSHDDDKWDVALAAWQGWFGQQFPDQPPAALPADNAANKWTYEDLSKYLASPEASSGSPERGNLIFAKANCIKCHRYGSRGEGVGPDLTNVSRRFQRKEILESVLYPSQVISDQYASKTVVTNDGLTYMGIVGPAGQGSIVVLQTTGEKKVIAEADISEIVPNPKSAMPEGLFNELTLEEIADLLAYLNQPPSN